MYISFRGVKVHPSNAKWGFRLSVAGLTILLIAVVADRVAYSPSVAFYSYMSAIALIAGAFVIMVPGVVIPVGLLLIPFTVAVVGVTHDREVWRSWWFWCLTVPCEVAGAFAVAWFCKKYEIRKN